MATSISVPIYNETDPVLPVSGNTPFGYYDLDPIFQANAPKFVKWAARKLGFPIIDVEMQYINFYANLEEGITVYGKELYEYKIRENYISIEGNSTSVNLNNAVITPSLGTVIRIASTYGSEAGVGGTTKYYTGSLPMVAFQQSYDLNYYASSSWGISGSNDLEVKRVFYEAPPAIIRFFDPYAGTGTGLQSLLETFGFGQMSPGINFMLMPINYDVLTIQAIELNDLVRKSAFSFNIVDNQLRIFPIPTVNANLQLIFIKKSERDSVVYTNDSGSVSNISNVPYTTVQYSSINGPATRWIYDYAYALCEENLGVIRNKFSQIPIPGDNVQLNGQQLITDGITKQTALITQLRDTLEQTSRTAQLQRKTDEGEMIGKTLGNSPMAIYIM